MPISNISGGRQQRLLRDNAHRWFLIFLLGFAAVITMLVLFQIVRHAEMARRARNLYHRQDVTLAAERGKLLDREHRALALDDDYFVAYADPTLVKSPAFMAAQLAPVLHLSEADIQAALTKTQTFTWLKQDVNVDEIAAVKAVEAPGVAVLQEGNRFQFTVDLAQFKRTQGVTARLARALGTTESELSKLTGDLDAPPEDPEKAPAGKIPLPGTVSGRVKDRVAVLNLRGVTFHDTGTPNYSIGVTTTPYLVQGLDVNLDPITKRLGAALNMPADQVLGRLQYRLRYSVIKKGLTDEEVAGMKRLSGTFFVAQPGALLENYDKKTDPSKKLTDAAKRLAGYLKPGDKSTGGTLLPPPSIEDVRRALQAEAPPGPLGVVLQADGRPYQRTEWSLEDDPIPGVWYGLPGVSVDTQEKRSYPYGTLAAPTLGFLNTAVEPPTGMFGLEETQEETLAGKLGVETKDIASNGMPVPGHDTRTEPVDGRDTVLTLDLGIQQAVEEELAKGVSDAKARAGYCVAMDPRNGEILALASTPGWDANHPEPTPGIPLVNPTVSNFYEPGSVFKVVAVMAALEEGVVHDGEIITDCTGSFAVGNRVIHEAKQEVHGPVDCGRLLEQSCNIGAAHLALMLGPDRFLKWAKLLGFGSRTGLGLPDESSGRMNEKNVEHAKITLANAGFGQSVAVTPLQVAAAYSVVANGGTYFQPHLLMGHVKPDGTLDKFTPQSHQVCKAATAELMRGYFERVVTKGTGTAAAIPGYRVAGKTGTAQKVVNGSYGGGLAIGSFVGIMPMQDPRLVIIVVIDEPSTTHYGGTVAAPVVAAIGRRALEILHLPPTEMVEQPADGDSGQ